VINNTKIVGLLLLLFFFSCKKNHSGVSEKKEAVLFDKNYFDALKKNKKDQYLDSIIAVLQDKDNNPAVRQSYLAIASEYYYSNNPKKSLAQSLKSLELSRQANDSSGIAKSLFYAGDCYQDSQKDSAYFYYLQAEYIYKKIHDTDNVGRMLFNKAYVLFYAGNYVECEVEISKALQQLKDSANYALLFSCNNLMGNCLEKLNHYDEALKYHELALGTIEKMQLSDKDESSSYQIGCIVNICNLYDIKGEYSKSVKRLESLISEDLKQKKPVLYAKVLGNLAYSKMKNGDYKNVKSMLFESLKIVDSIGTQNDILYKKISIGEYYLTQKDTLQSIKFLKESNHLAFKIKNSTEILKSLKLLSKIDKKNSLIYTNEYIKLSDSINTVQKNAYNKFARIQYETSKVEDENKVLTKKNFYILIVSFGLILVLLLIIILRYLKYKNRELQFVKKEQKANEEINQLLTEQNEKISLAQEHEKTKIAKELHDGIMNKIYGVRMNLGFFNAKTDQEIIKKRLEYIAELQNIENEIRMISHDLSRNSFIESNDFNTLLSGLLEKYQHISHTHFNYQTDAIPDWAAIPNIYKINLYRIIQEALLNTDKHANAKNCDIKIQIRDKNLLKLVISDDGKGFDLKNKKRGIGLSNIKDRTEALKGQFDIESKLGGGTKIEITFNLQIQGK